MNNVFEDMKSNDEITKRQAFATVEELVKEYLKKQGREATYRDVVFWTRKLQYNNDYVLAITENISFIDFDKWMWLQDKLKEKISFSSTMKIMEILEEENISILD
jgi:hypothetical protein